MQLTNTTDYAIRIVCYLAIKKRRVSRIFAMLLQVILSGADTIEKEYILLVNQIKMIADRIESPNDDYEKMIGLFHQKASILMEIAYLQGA